MSSHQLSTAEIESMPSILGEADVIKIIQLLPGTKSGREGFNDLYVRGGQPDQNLILLDGLPLYNPNHRAFCKTSVFDLVGIADKVSFFKRTRLTEEESAEPDKL